METYVPHVVSEGKPVGAGAEQKHRDDRRPDELRKTYLKTGVVSRAAGSAYVEVGKTKIICSVYGPRRLKKNEFSDIGKLSCDFRFASFAVQSRRSRGKESDEREYSVMMTETLSVAVMLDKFPKSVIDVYVLVLEDDGGVLGAAVTCASLALADAGVEMYDIITACSASEVGTDIVLDPSAAEENAAAGGDVLLSYMLSLNQITHITQTGSVSTDKIQEMIDACIDGCSQIYALVQRHLLSSRQSSGDEIAQAADEMET